MERMSKLRRSLRESFRRKKESAPESSKPHQWQSDEESVRAGSCTYHVKYLGCVEVFESRGMQVCEEAMKVLRGSRRRPVKGSLYVTGDGLRVVEDETKGLIVDQTIEKVSFCAPDRNNERGFSYICRDGTTRRWMCHGFLASKNSGERLSHAVGCAFAVCLERKQKREKEVSLSYDPKKGSNFTRSASCRLPSLSNNWGKEEERKVQMAATPNSTIINSNPTTTTTTPITPTAAIERPHAPTKMLERQGSFRGFSQLSSHSPFKRQLSLRLSELPSNLQRMQGQGLQFNSSSEAANPNHHTPSNDINRSHGMLTRNRLNSLPCTPAFGGIKESSKESSQTGLDVGSTKIENKDLELSELCQEVSKGLSMLAANHEVSPKYPVNPWDNEVLGIGGVSALPILNTTTPTPASSAELPYSKPLDSWINNLTTSHAPKSPLQPKIGPIKENIPVNLQMPKEENTSRQPQQPAPLHAKGRGGGVRGGLSRSQSDPFDADWANPIARTGQTATNPFSTRTQTFQISM